MRELIQVGELTHDQWDKKIDELYQNHPRTISVVKIKLPNGNFQFMISAKSLPKSAMVRPKAYLRKIYNFTFAPKKHRLSYYNGPDHKEFIVSDPNWGNIAKAVSDIASFDWIENNAYAQNIFKKDQKHYLEMQALAKRCLADNTIKQNGVR